jgi:hypothetical protein
MKNKMLLFARSGNPGSKFKPQFERMLKNMTLPPHAKQHCGIVEDSMAGMSITQANETRTSGMNRTQKIDKDAKSQVSNKHESQMSQLEEETLSGRD